MQATPQKVGVNAPRVLDPRNAYVMTTMMQDVVRYGTAARAGQLGRNDIAGKTGTTNDARDTWFAGYTPQLVAITWMGYDQPRSMGRAETGSQASLPIWINFMASALKRIPPSGWTAPPGVVTMTIDPLTGLKLPEGESGLVEHFYQEYVPDDATLGGEDFLPDGDPRGDSPPAPTLPGTPL
jgi:penicillin-binding protein 1A